MADEPVLVVTSLEDVTADLVITELNRRGVPVVRLDPADIGDGLTFAARIGDVEPTWCGRAHTRTRDLDLGRVRSVYHRRPGPWRFDHLERRTRDFAAAEARHGLTGVLNDLPVLHVNAPLANARAEYKPSQLRAAAELGFTVPATLITNDVAAARRFADEHGGVIYKSFRGVPPSDGVTGVIWTQRVKAADLDETLSVTAHMFQAEVEKTADVRITVVGRDAFASRIEAPNPLLDWRSGDWDQLKYTSIDLPEHLAARLVAYLDRFGLAFGCFDFAVDRVTGQLNFIECNPNGQWGFLPDSGAIADAFAALLQAG
ncbi:ATP-grasp ribosomal peptide maturase [Actinomadura sp. 1N219]|uniref:ATP-grasp ribosomal peptide maturase n=1 Tax=Actinomadura sp. 1N219 TaxID=3375152 RepID=UPI0037BAA415